MKNTNFVRFLPAFVVLLLFSGTAFALNEHNLASLLGVSSGSTEALSYEGTGKYDSVYIGKQDVGGVTFFNGTIVNQTTDTNGDDNPVTFGDDVRIDGKIMRLPGTADKPVQIDDDLDVDGDITADNLFSKTDSDARYVASANPQWTTRTGYVEVPPSAFVPEDQNVSYTRDQGILFDNTAGTSMFFAPVDLPHRATVTRLEMIRSDMSAQDMRLELVAVPIQSLSGGTMTTFPSLGLAISSGSPGIGVDVDSSITNSTVDNLTYGYELDLRFNGLAGANNILYGARVTYTYDEPY